jgi:MFS transporter, ACS family, tartrate transporter
VSSGMIWQTRGIRAGSIMHSRKELSSDEPSPNRDEKAPDASTADANAIVRKISIRLIPLLFLLYVLAYLDRINISFAGLEMNRQLGFSDQVFGLGAGIFFCGYFLFGVPSNLLVERLGARRWISMIMLAWGCISVAMAWAVTPAIFYGLRFALGVAEAGFFPGVILYLTYWFPSKERGLAVARFMSAIPVAGVLGALVSSMLLGMAGICGIAGWKWLFILTGLPSVFSGIIVWFCLCDRPEEASWLSNAERERLLDLLQQDRQACCASVAPGDNAGTGSVGVMSAFKDPRVWFFACLYFCLTLSMYGFQLWLPQIISAFGHMDNSKIALLSIIPAVCQAGGMLVVAGSSDRSGERRLHMAASACLAAMGLFACAMVHDPVAALAALSVTAFGIWGTVGPFWSMPTAGLSKASAATGIALINSVGNLGGFAGPYIVGLIKGATANVGLALVVMGLALLSAALMAVASPFCAESRRAVNAAGPDGTHAD